MIRYRQTGRVDGAMAVRDNEPRMPIKFRRMRLVVPGSYQSASVSRSKRVLDGHRRDEPLLVDRHAVRRAERGVHSIAGRLTFLSSS
jgi:hypothetical protein